MSCSKENSGLGRSISAAYMPTGIRVENSRGGQVKKKTKEKTRKCKANVVGGSYEFHSDSKMETRLMGYGSSNRGNIAGNA